MLKFFRKYNKLILAVGGSLLMVVFLLPQALTQVGQGSRDPVVATIGGRDVLNSELMHSRAALNFYESMLPPQARGQGSIVHRLIGVNFVEGRPDDEHWHLLVENAREGGFVGGPQDGRNWIGELAQNIAAAQQQQVDYQRRLLESQGVDPSILGVNNFDQVAFELELFNAMTAAADRANFSGIGQYRTAPGEVDQMLAEARGVIRMYNAYERSIKLSDLEAIRDVRDQFDQARVDYAMIGTNDLVDSMPQPTEEEIQAQFDEFRDIIEGEGRHGFGYRLDPVVSAEWLKINRNLIDENVQLDPIAVSARYQRDKSRYAADFSEARPIVEREMRNEQAEDVAQRAVRLLQAELLKREPDYPTVDGVTEVPEDWNSRKADFQEIADAVNADLAEFLGGVFPVVDARLTPGAVDRESMNSLLRNDIGGAAQRRGPTRIRFDDLAFNTRELNEDTPLEVQVGPVDRRFLTDPSGNIYFYRLLDARPARPADDLEDLRGKIVADLKRLKAYEAMIELQDTLRTDAIVDFNRAITDQNVTLTTDINVRHNIMSNAATGQGVPSNFNNEDVRTAIMTHVESLDPRLGAIDRGPEQNIIVVPSPEFLELALVRINSVEPIAQETYRRLEPRIADSPNPEIGGLANGPDWPFSKDRLAAKLNYVPDIRETLDDEEESVEESAVATGS